MTGKNGSVLLFIGGLSEAVDRDTLKATLKEALKPFRRIGLSAQGCVGFCDLLQVTERDTGKSEINALVEIQPAKAALHAIRVLDGSLVQGQRIHVHRYRNRATSALVGAGLQSPAATATPREDRRRQNLNVDLLQRQSGHLAGRWTRWLAPLLPSRSLSS